METATSSSIGNTHVAKHPFFSFSVFLLGVVLLVTLIYGALSYLTQQDILKLKEETDVMLKQAEGIMTDEVEQIDQAIRMTSALSVDKIQWSSFLVELFSLFPPGIAMSSLQGDIKGKVTLHLVSSSSEEVVTVLDRLRQSPLLQDVFIPSLSSGATIESGALMHFPVVLEIRQKVTHP